MSNMDQLQQVEAITNARYHKQQQSFQRLVGEECRLRSELAKLDLNFRQARRSQVQFEMTTIGADVIWQAWVGKRKAELNMKLAQVLAIKEHHLKQVRVAYGKVIVAGELLTNARQERQDELARKALLRAIEMSQQ